MGSGEMGSGRQVSLILATFDWMSLLFCFVFVRALIFERMSALGVLGGHQVCLTKQTSQLLLKVMAAGERAMVEG